MDGTEPSQEIDSLHSALSKIRHHTNSKLENQKAPAQLLVAIESTLDEQEGPASKTTGASQHATKERQPAEYFLALESMLDKAQSMGPSSSLLSSVVYLLALVTPHVSSGIIRARQGSLVAAIGSILSSPHPTFQDTAQAESYPATLRSAISVLEAIVQSFSSDLGSLDKDIRLRGCWNSVLNLCADTRPKVRRRAHQLVGAILPSSSFAGLVAKPKHPYVIPTFEWCIKTLTHVADAGSVVAGKKIEHQPQYDKKSGKAKQASAAAALRQKQVTEGDSASVGVWVCGFTKQIAGNLPTSLVDSLCAVLLRLPGLQNPFLTVAALDVFESVFKACRSASTPDPAQKMYALQGSTTSAPSIGQKTLAHLIDSLRSPAMVPSTNDVQLLPSYLGALEEAVATYSQFDSGRPAWQIVPQIWSDIFSLALSAKSEASRNSSVVRTAGRDALVALVRYCVPNSAVSDAVKAKQASSNDSAFILMIASVHEALGQHSLQFMHSRPEVLAVLTAIIGRLRHTYVNEGQNASKRQSTAGLLTFELVKEVAHLRSQPGFEYREAADAVIGSAVEVAGPRMVLDALPLNLFGKEGGQGRAWLLPLMRTKITNTELSHFSDQLVPLSEELFNRRAQAEKGEPDGVPRPVEAKMWEALTEQVWALFPAYCDMPFDLTQAFTRQFAELLTNVLYSQPALRPSVCRGLKALVERNQALVSSGATSESLLEAFGLDQKSGQANIAHLSDLAPSLLAVLFNVFSQSPGQARAFVYECICAYLAILKDSDISNTYAKVKTTLDQSLASLPTNKVNKDAGTAAIPPVPHTMLDLLVALIPHLRTSGKNEAGDLFELATSDRFLRSTDSGLQKKTYKVLSRLVEGSTGKQVLKVTGKTGASASRVGELLTKLRDATPQVASGAKRDRILLLANLIPNIPDNELHHLPSIIPEAVLATKEANQGTRDNAYELLVQMGHKMESGGTIDRSLVEGTEPVAASDDAIVETTDEDMTGRGIVSATITEYLTMVAAGLAGSTPHMISATITSLSRLVYEFKDDLAQETLDEMLATVEVFLKSANREIVKSALGFVKVAIVDFNLQLMDKHLPTLIPSLLGWSSEHRQHFKVKVRHMFERLIRRFGFERVAQFTDDDGRKLITNIKKRKERAKRQKAQRAEGDAQFSDEDATPRGKALRSAGNAFEDVIYGSESEISGSDSDGDDAAAAAAAPATASRRNQKAAAGGKPAKSKGRRNQEDDAYIMEDDDEPMDLLDRSAAAKIVATDPGAKADRRRKPGQDASKFSLDEATGRLLINDPEAMSKGAAASAVGAASGDLGDVDGAGRAYLDKERGVDGMTFSGRGGAVKFNKNNKRTREQERELEMEQIAIEEAEAGATKEKTKKRKKEKERIGSEFRARRAEGDVIRDGKSPYAYIPLSQVAGKKSKGRAQEISFTGKDRRGKRK